MYGEYGKDFFPNVAHHPFTIVGEQTMQLSYDMQKLGPSRIIISVNNTRHAQYLARNVLMSAGTVIASPEQPRFITTWALDL